MTLSPFTPPFIGVTACSTTTHCITWLLVYNILPHMQYWNTMQSHSHVAVIMLGFMIIFIGCLGIMLSNFKIIVNARTTHDINPYARNQTIPNNHLSSIQKSAKNGENTKLKSKVGHSTLAAGRRRTNITIVDERQKGLWNQQ